MRFDSSLVTNTIRIHMDNIINNNMNINQIKERASNKSFSKVLFRQIEINDYNQAIRSGLHGGVTETETRICLEATKKELKVWKYINQLIKNDK